MKAARIHEYGRISVLRYEEAPMPECTADEMLICVVGSSMSPVDWQIRQWLLGLGAKGRAALSDLLLNSAAQRPLASAEVPVLLVS
jgi:NADPH:quinone reductase-like Zn-dependent oxidoreductase